MDEKSLYAIIKEKLKNKVTYFCNYYGIKIHSNIYIEKDILVLNILDNMSYKIFLENYNSFIKFIFFSSKYTVKQFDINFTNESDGPYELKFEFLPYWKPEAFRYRKGVALWKNRQKMMFY